jgi:hypothetical protein
MKRENKKHREHAWFLYLLPLHFCLSKQSLREYIPTGVVAENDHFLPANMAVEIPIKSGQFGGKEDTFDVFCYQGKTYEDLRLCELRWRSCWSKASGRCCSLSLWMKREDHSDEER